MNLNKEQQEVVNCNDSRILCLAGAGTGKTHCMISRVCRLVDEGVDPRSILVLTFTNAAAFEMRERYMKRSKYPVAPEFRTFHSFCYSILSSNKKVLNKLGYSKVPSIATPEEEKRIMKEAELQLNIHLSEKKMSGKEVLTAKEQFEYDTLLKAHKRVMKQREFITFDKLCYDICQMFVDDDSDILQYKERYKYIMVDEFQDTDPKQYKFVSSFSDSMLFLVGDALQAIYSFRGADSSIIKDLSDSKKWRTFKLFRNYRSTKSICDFANSVTAYARDSYKVLIDSDKPGGAVNVLTSSGFTRYGNVPEGSVMAAVIACKDNVGTTAILCRTNAEVNNVKKVLDENNILYESGSNNQDAVNILEAVKNNRFLIDWLSSKLGSEEYAEYIRQSTIDPDNPREYTVRDFLDTFGNVKAVSDRWEVVSKIRKACLDPNCPVVTKIGNILSILDLSKVVIDETVISLDTLIEFLSNKQAERVNDNMIYVGTIHSSKGLEYDNVLVLGVDGPSFPLTNEENNNIYYVAVTRARTNLVVIKSSGVRYARR